MTQRVEKLLEDVKNLSKNGKIAVYGAGLLAKYLLLKTDLKNFNIIGIADDDKEKWESYIGKFKIDSKEKIIKDADFVLVTMSNFNKNIADYLKTQNKKALFVNRTLYFLLSDDISYDEKVDDILIKFKKPDYQPNLLKILILKLDYFGDTTLSLAFLQEIRAKYKQAFIDVICTSENYLILKELGIFSKFYISKDFSRSKEGMSIDEILKSIDKYDIAIDIGFGPDTRYLLKYINATYKISLESFEDGFDNYLHLKIPYISKGDSVTKLLMDYINLIPDIKSQKTKNNIIKNIAIFPTPSSTIKQWLYFEDFIRLLEKENIDTINIYSDKKIFDIDSPKVKYHIGLDFRSLIDSLSQNDLAISVDSFGAHASSYAGLPVVCMFFDSSTIEFSPSYSESIILFKHQNMNLEKYNENIYRYTSNSLDMAPEKVLKILKSYYVFKH
ncbi:MAG: hypothetical protein C0170_05255 [Hydrogenobaculum sp.]|nr:MAG: hypothetical protein C0170_05255 [Hydrogenobaculum sp.]